jgi:hypothetical protein
MSHQAEGIAGLGINMEKLRETITEHLVTHTHTGVFQCGCGIQYEDTVIHTVEEMWKGLPLEKVPVQVVVGCRCERDIQEALRVIIRQRRIVREAAFLAKVGEEHIKAERVDLAALKEFYQRLVKVNKELGHE